MVVIRTTYRQQELYVQVCQFFHCQRCVSEIRTVMCPVRGCHPSYRPVSIQGHLGPTSWQEPWRPSHTWLRAVRDDLNRMNFSLAMVWRKATNPDAWRTIVDTARLKTSRPTGICYEEEREYGTVCRRSMNSSNSWFRAAVTTQECWRTRVCVSEFLHWRCSSVN